MTCIVSGGALNSTHSLRILTHSLFTFSTCTSNMAARSYAQINDVTASHGLAAWLSGKDVDLRPALCPIHGWQVANMWVNCPLWVTELGQLSLPSLPYLHITEVKKRTDYGATHKCTLWRHRCWGGICGNCDTIWMSLPCLHEKSFTLATGSASGCTYSSSMLSHCGNGGSSRVRFDLPTGSVGSCRFCVGFGCKKTRRNYALKSTKKSAQKAERPGQMFSVGVWKC